MRRLVVLVAVFVSMLPTAAMASDLDDLLSRSQQASYSAEQAISCSTPDGVRDAIVRITRAGDEMTLSSSVTDEIEIAAGSGNWSLRQGGGVIAQAVVRAGEESATESVYEIVEETPVEFLGRDAHSYLLVRVGEPRAELIFDDETGVLVEAVTLTTGGEVYCERRFISFDAGTTAESLAAETGEPDGTPPAALEGSPFPDEILGFQRLDQYEDADGVRFAYYSDGFFSFAFFETESPVDLPEATVVELDSGIYGRVFTAGQVTYVWETSDAGMTLVGDLPPDLHPAVLAALPHPQDPGFLRRWWRNVFG